MSKRSGSGVSPLSLRLDTMRESKRAKRRVELDEVSVELTPPPPPSDAELGLALQELLRSHARFEPRAPGAPVERGDEVEVDLVGYADGKIVPHTTVTDLWLRDAIDPMYPGLRAALVGAKVGERKLVQVVFPHDHPIESLRGLPILYAVNILAARRAEEPTLDEPRFLQAVGGDLARVVETLESALLAQWEEEVQTIAELAVLDELAARTTIEVDDWMVEAEVRARWQSAEGEALNRQGVSPGEAEQALDRWLVDEALRAEAKAIIARHQVVLAVLEQEKIDLEPRELGEFIVHMAEDLATSAEEVAADLDAASELERDAIAQRLVYRKAMAFIMAHARVTLREP